MAEPTINIDADVANADWTKQTWDYAAVPLDYWETTDIAEIERIAVTPAHEAAPAAVKEIIERRLAEHA